MGYNCSAGLAQAPRAAVAVVVAQARAADQVQAHLGRGSSAAAPQGAAPQAGAPSGEQATRGGCVGGGTAVTDAAKVAR